MRQVYSIGHVARVQLFDDVPAVSLDRLDGSTQARRCLVRRLSFGGTGENLSFALGNAARPGARGLIAEKLEGLALDLRYS